MAKPKYGVTSTSLTGLFKEIYGDALFGTETEEAKTKRAKHNEFNTSVNELLGIEAPDLIKPDVAFLADALTYSKLPFLSIPKTIRQANPYQIPVTINSKLTKKKGKKK